MHTSQAINRTRAIVIAAIAAVGIAGVVATLQFRAILRRNPPLGIGITTDRARTSCTY